MTFWKMGKKQKGVKSPKLTPLEKRLAEKAAKEEVEDVLGKVIVRKKEIRLPKPPGE